MSGKYGFRLLIGIFLISFAFDGTRSEGQISDAGACRDIMGLLMKHILEGIGTCSRTMEFKNMKDRAAKFQCIIKCVAVKYKVLSPTGGLDKATIEAFVQNDVPANFREKAAPLLLGCYKKHAESVNPSEEYCKSYRPFMKCFLDSLPTFCPTEPAAA